MSVLVSLAQAKNHLRISDAANNTDLTLKISQASAIVLNYLKGRYITVSEITNSGGVATVTTSELHGLTTNDVVAIFGALEEEYNGAYTVTVTSTSAFTFAIAGTPTSPATGHVRLRTAFGWTDSTVPADVQSAVLLVLTDLFLGRPIDFKSVEWLLVGHRDPAIA